MVSSKDLVDDGGGFGVRIQLHRQSLEAALLQPVHKVAQELVGVFLSPLSKVLPYNCVHTDTVYILLRSMQHHCYTAICKRHYDYYATRESKKISRWMDF